MPFSPFQGMISEKSFLGSYIHFNGNTHSKFYMFSFNSFGSALICQQLQYHPVRGWFLKKSYLTGYIQHNRNLHSKLYVYSLSKFDSALTCHLPAFHLFRGWFQKNRILVVTYSPQLQWQVWRREVSIIGKENVNHLLYLSCVTYCPASRLIILIIFHYEMIAS